LYGSVRDTEKTIVYSTSKDTRVSAERRRVREETSSLTFGYGLRDKSAEDKDTK